MKFDWDSKTLYKGESKHPYLWSFVLVSLFGFGLWFTFGGSHVIWLLIRGVLHI